MPGPFLQVNLVGGGNEATRDSTLTTPGGGKTVRSSQLRVPPTLHRKNIGLFDMRMRRGLTCYSRHYSLVSQCGTSQETKALVGTWVRRVYREDSFGIGHLLRRQVGGTFGLFSRCR